jgi:Predicted thioesterase
MYDLRDIIQVGRSASITHVVTNDDAATKYSKGLEELLATPACIRLAIQAAAVAVDKYLPEGYVSIGRAIEFEHTASTRVGMRITVDATVIEVQPLYMVLKISVYDAVGEIGFGTHRRSIVNMESLLARSKRREAMQANDRPL